MSKIEVPSKLFIGELELDCTVTIIGDETGVTGVSRILLDDEDMFPGEQAIKEIEELFMSKFKTGEVHG